MKKFIVISIIFLCVALYGESLWKDSNLFSSRAVLKVGDIVKIRFNYKSLIRYRNAMVTGNTSKTEVNKPGISFFAFLPSVTLNSSASRNVKVDYATQKEFKTVLAATVRAILANNILELEASHSILVNGQQEVITIRGKVRTQDLRAGNTIVSTDIADLAFIYRGPSALQRNALAARDLVYTASTNTNVSANGTTRSQLPKLAEATRRRLVLQYLNRIASLLFRQ